MSTCFHLISREAHLCCGMWQQFLLNSFNSQICCLIYLPRYFIPEQLRRKTSFSEDRVWELKHIGLCYSYGEIFVVKTFFLNISSPHSPRQVVRRPVIPIGLRKRGCTPYVIACYPRSRWGGRLYNRELSWGVLIARLMLNTHPVALLWVKVHSKEN